MRDPSPDKPSPVDLTGMLLLISLGAGLGVTIAMISWSAPFLSTRTLAAALIGVAAGCAAHELLSSDRAAHSIVGRLYARQLVLFACSIAMGAVFGAAYAYYVDPLAGAFFGALVGFAFSPAVLWGVSRKPLTVALPIIFVPTLLFAIAAGLLSIACYVAMCAFVRYAVPDSNSNYPAYACQACGYDLRGLPERSPCPECGAGLNPPADSDHPDAPAG